MNSARLSVPWVMLAVFAVALMLGLYFTFAAVQGDYGLFRRAEILSDAKKLEDNSKLKLIELLLRQNEFDLVYLAPAHLKGLSLGTHLTFSGLDCAFYQPHFEAW